jgi:hypothetical protein
MRRLFSCNFAGIETVLLVFLTRSIFKQRFGSYGCLYVLVAFMDKSSHQFWWKGIFGHVPAWLVIY